MVFLEVLSRSSWVCVSKDTFYREARTRLSQGKSYRQVEQLVGDLYRGLKFSISPLEDDFPPEKISSSVVIV